MVTLELDVWLVVPLVITSLGLSLLLGLLLVFLFLRHWKTIGRTAPEPATPLVGRAEGRFPGLGQARTPKTFSGDAQTFKEWSFCVELALRANRICDGLNQTDFAASFLDGNALLWYISCLESGRAFANWESLKEGLAESFGPLDVEEESRLSLFSLTQEGNLDGYIREFSRLSLNVSELDQHSRALLFVRGLQDNLRYDAMREHPKTLAEAIRAARTAQQNISQASWNYRGRKKSGSFNRRPASPTERIRTQSPERRQTITDEERAQLLREGRCFKCRKVGHLSRNCPGKVPNADRQ